MTSQIWICEFLKASKTQKSKYLENKAIFLTQVKHPLHKAPMCIYYIYYNENKFLFSFQLFCDKHIQWRNVMVDSNDNPCKATRQCFLWCFLLEGNVIIQDYKELLKRSFLNGRIKNQTSCYIFTQNSNLLANKNN